MDTELASSLHFDPTDQLDRLESWKLIASYLGRQVRTVQRWECDENLPVHRHLHSKGSSVYAFKHEIDAWLLDRRPRLTFGALRNHPGIRGTLNPTLPKRPQVAVLQQPEPRPAEPSRCVRSEPGFDAAFESLELCIGAHRIRISFCASN